MEKMKSQSWIILEVGGILFIGMLIAAFFPINYEKGFWFIITVFGTQFANLLGNKSGGSMPQQAGDPKEGQSSKSETTSKITTEAPQEPPPLLPAVEAPK